MPWLQKIWRPETPRLAHNEQPRVLSVIREQSDREVLSSLALPVGCAVEHANDLTDALRRLQQERYAVVFYDRAAESGEWRDGVSALARVSGKSCIVLLSRVNDEYLWSEVVQAGGFDVLKTPLEPATTSQAMALALSYWRSSTRSHPSGPHTGSTPGSRGC